MRVSVFLLGLAISTSAAAQSPQPTRVTLPTVTVTAQKEPADPQDLPVSLSIVPLDAVWNGGMTTIGEASIYAPNTYFTDFTARKLSNPRFRGIGASPANPSVTTFIDGVPQLNTNSSSLELIDVSQLEFVRGPQSALFGRNTLGGLVNMTSVRPSLTKWIGTAAVPFGNFSAFDASGSASGPIGGKAAVGFALGHSQRDGFTTNDVTGHDVDSRDGTFGKAQLLFTPAGQWEVRAIYTGERDRDGDYALNDLGALRSNPFQTSRDFEGHTDRDVNSGTFLTRYAGKQIVFASTTGIVHWSTSDLTDLDYTAAPLLTRSNDEKATQFTQEFRFASAPAAPLTVSGQTTVRWQGGVFLFTQNYDQAAATNFAPFVLSPFIPFATSRVTPAALDDRGVGLYGNGTFAFGDRMDLTVGARFDHENKKAALSTIIVAPVPIAPDEVVNEEKGFSNVSPQAAFSYRVRPGAIAYFSITGGYKAGGFNPESPAGQEAYGQEKTWNVEGGFKSALAGRRVTANVSVFTTDWTDLQLNLPNPTVPGGFFISNVGGARSSGFEAEVNGRAREGVDLFAAFGYTHARFDSGTTSSGVPVGGNEIPNTPDYTMSFGTHLTHPLNSSVRLYGHAEAVFYGAFKYDDTNLAQQDAYSLANFRGGARGKRLFAEAWIRNAFDTHYIPVAFPYFPQLAPSGFIGEMGRPRTFGVTAGVSF